MRKTYEECIELGNNRSIDDIVDQKHILEESLRYLFSRRCSQAGATDKANCLRLDTPVTVNGGNTCVLGLYEVECEGFIVFVTDKGGELLIDAFNVSDQIDIACAIEDTNSEYDED